jgi:hypothetical protein
MKSMFNINDNQEIIDRINKLTPDTNPQWGTMDVSKMLAHSTIALKIAFGEIKPQSNIFLKMVGKTFKKKIFAADSFRKNSPTGRDFIVTRTKNFDEEKPVLISYVKKFIEKSTGIITKESHPFFGRLTVEEWDSLMYKHLDHHLRQFGN